MVTTVSVSQCRMPVFQRTIREMGSMISEDLFRGPFSYLFLLLLRRNRLSKLRLQRVIKVVMLPKGLHVVVPQHDYQSLAGSIHEIYVEKEYEALPEYLPQRSYRVLDVGAFMGLYTLKTSLLVGDEGSVIAVEPVPRTFQLLVSNILINKLKNVIPLEAALANFNGKAVLYIPDTTLVASLYKVHVTLHTTRMEVTETRAITLTELLTGLHINHIDLAKIDTEGAELSVLQGGVEVLRRGIIERLIVEVHRTVVDLLFLKENSFRIERCVKKVKKPANIVYARLTK